MTFSWMFSLSWITGTYKRFEEKGADTSMEGKDESFRDPRDFLSLNFSASRSFSAANKYSATLSSRDISV